MSFLRKGNILALVGGAVLVWLAAALFLDPWLRRALVRYGQAAAGAKVEVGALRSSLFRGSLSLSGVAVADKNEPMKNIVEFDAAVLRVSRRAALRGRIVVSEASLNGLRFGTPRKTSGALPRSFEPTGLERAVLSRLGSAQDAGISKLSEAKSNAVVELDAAKLSCLKRLDEAKADADAVTQRYKDKPAEYKAMEAELRKAVEELRAGGDALRKAQAAAAAQRKLKAMLSKVEADKKELNADLERIRSAAKAAEALKGEDLDAVLAAAGLPSLDSASLAKRLLGPVLAKRFSTALYWMDWTRKRLAKKPAQAEAPTRQRRKGVDVEFPLKHPYPVFLLEQASVSGFLEGGAAFEGRLSGVTSDAPMYGKPARLELEASSFRTLAVFDQVRSPGSAAVEFEADGLPLAGVELGDGGLGAVVAEGRAKARGEIRLSGERWDGELRLDAEGLELQPRGLDAAAPVLRGLKRFQARIRLSGQGDSMDLSLESDIGKALAAALLKQASGALADQRKALEEKLAVLYDAKSSALRERLGGLESSALGPMLKQEKAVQEALRSAMPKGFDKLFRR
ncbi:MAG: TIGR03545 family protein [Elusimicrobiota bacterium]